MNPADFHLLFHHHDIAFRPNAQQICLTAGIGRWVSALASHFRQITLLLHESVQTLPHQDYLLSDANVALASLGTSGYYVDYPSRIRRIRKVCQEIGQNADGILIRGLTPRQYVVWQSTPVRHKAFLLVRSPRQSRLVNANPLTILSALINKYREYEFGQIVKHQTLMMANSPLHIQELQAIYGVLAHFVPTNTIRLAEFSPLMVRPLNQPLRLLFCGRLHVLKGVRELLESVAILRTRGLICTVELAGALEEPAYTEFRRLAESLGILSEVRWYGRLPFGDELIRLYRSADIFVLPTYTEGFPRVIWESAANCCPVITTSVGGIPALIQHEREALMVPPKNAMALADAIYRVATEPALRQRLVEQAYQLVQDYSVEACAQKMAQLLAQEWN